MRKYRNQIILGFAFSFSIYIILLLLLDGSGQFSETEGILDALRSFDASFLILILVTQFLVMFFRFIEWHYYLGVIGARDKISLFDSALIFVTGFTFVVSPAKAAEVLKSVMLKIKTNVPISLSSPIIIAERVVDGFAVILILFAMLISFSQNLELGDYLTISQSVIFVSALLLISGLVIVQIAPLAYFFLNLSKSLPLIKRAYQPLVAFYESSREIFKLRHVIPMVGVGVGVYLFSSLEFLLILAGFHLNIGFDLFLQCAFIVGISSAIGALSFIPNGAGITEFSTAALLLVIVAPSQPALIPPVIAAASLLQGFFHKWFRVLVGMLVGFIFFNRLFPADEVDDILNELENEELLASNSSLNS